jgi:hypothetical protein
MDQVSKVIKLIILDETFHRALFEALGTIQEICKVSLFWNKMVKYPQGSTSLDCSLAMCNLHKLCLL